MHGAIDTAGLLDSGGRTCGPENLSHSLGGRIYLSANMPTGRSGISSRLQHWHIALYLRDTSVFCTSRSCQDTVEAGLAAATEFRFPPPFSYPAPGFESLQRTSAPEMTWHAMQQRCKAVRVPAPAISGRHRCMSPGERMQS